MLLDMATSVIEYPHPIFDPQGKSPSSCLEAKTNNSLNINWRGQAASMFTESLHCSLSFSLSFSLKSNQHSESKWNFEVENRPVVP